MKEQSDHKDRTFFGYKISSYLYTLVGLIILILVVSLWIELTDAFKLVFGSIYALFIPGFLISFLFYDKNTLEISERLPLSFALSISIVPIVVFFLNLGGFTVSTLHTVLTILVISTISLIVAIFRRNI